MELDAANQDLRRIQTEFESSVESKISTFNQESEAKHQAKVNSLKANQPSKEIVAIQESFIHVKLQNCKAELEAVVAVESKAISASDKLTSTLQQLKFKSDCALQEAKAMKQEAATLRIETESKRSSLLEIQKKLEVALKDAEAAKDAETQAIKEIKNLSARASSTRLSTSAESRATAEITISKDEYESLSCMVEESEKLAEMAVVVTIASSV